ncbi:N-glycosylase/DNA lyase-like isoform X2 [Convolutriloba macropyga]|uniref:N-glycosylase/DNA lyase-like isoform X2 n=1 Tax=Convolutriloba macropyga TaxID=536237 RepID=UPI003F5270E8
MSYSVQFVHDVCRHLLNLPCMLTGGQNFRWKERSLNQYIGVIRNYIVEVEQKQTQCCFKLTSNVKIEENTAQELITDYLQLQFPIEKYYKLWSEADPKHFKTKAEKLPGVRMLRQDPFENVISFICSQNNNISRISQLVNKVCTNFGKFIAHVDGTDFYSFPTLEELLEVKELEKKLRDLSFGYRAAYIAKTVQFLSKQETKGDFWLNSLRGLPYDEAKQQLLLLPGIGPKIAQRDYGFSKGQRSASLTAAKYTAITEFFQDLFGDHAGWAHTVLFCSDLRVVPGKRQLEEIDPNIHKTEEITNKLIKTDGENVKKEPSLS